MKLASLKSAGRDGRLVVVSRDLSRAVSAAISLTPSVVETIILLISRLVASPSKNGQTLRSSAHPEPVEGYAAGGSTGSP